MQRSLRDEQAGRPTRAGGRPVVVSALVLLPTRGAGKVRGHRTSACRWCCSCSLWRSQAESRGTSSLHQTHPNFACRRRRQLRSPILAYPRRVSGSTESSAYCCVATSGKMAHPVAEVSWAAKLVAQCRIRRIRNKKL